MDIKEKEYVIRVPIYTTKLKEWKKGTSYKDAIDKLKNDIDSYNKREQKEKSDKRNKTKTKEIEYINYYENTLGNIPALLLKITANDINLRDGYLQTETRINFERTYKLGSENNYALLYPNVIGVDSETLQAHWLVLIYEDPNKDNDEIVKCVKMVLQKILHLSLQNIKSDDILQELRKIGTIPELEVKLTGVNYDDNGVDAKYQQYHVEWKLKKEKEDKFKHMPFNLVEEMINEDIDYKEYQKKEFKFKIGKKEYRITHTQIEDAREKMQQTVEAIFTDSCIVFESEMEKIYNEKFILEKIYPILINYLSSYDG
ncbi:hypothetical protein EZS27_026117 [termite gut metagenome]|uniref:Uncharacterized protein n=1 Tax=termite gut metagenome TaxID=433724 RepID=A0A5J4QRT3_9ZZZZ